jgi:hypothetical protein
MIAMHQTRLKKASSSQRRHNEVEEGTMRPKKVQLSQGSSNSIQ